jgi:hypothetical protein
MPSWRALMMRWNNASIPRWPTTTNAYFTAISLEPLGALCVPLARSKDRTLIKEQESLGKGSRRHSLLKERGKPTSGESTTILPLVPPPPKLYRGG